MKAQQGTGRNPSAYSRMARAIFMVQIALVSFSAQAGVTDQAMQMHKRLTQVEPTQAVLSQMVSLISQGNHIAAALVAIDHDKNDLANVSFSPRAKYFYDVTLRSMFNSWVTNANLPNTPLNDYYALLIGAVREGIPFKEVLYSDLIFVGQGTGVAAYNYSANNNYTDLENKVIQGTASLAAEVDFRQDVQENVITANGTINLDMVGNKTAGALTLRGFGNEFYTAGTNRRVAQTIYKEYLCSPLMTIKDNTISDHRVRRDVDRSPSGDSMQFISNCKGCHGGMDAQMGAFGSYQFTNNRINGNSTNYAGQNVGGGTHKYNQNGNVFPQGYVTVNDDWSNPWVNGQNSALGWDLSQPTSGFGAEPWGRMIAHTDAFATCMAKRAFTQMCAREPALGEEVYINNLTNTFVSQNYSMKGLLAEAASLPPCRGN